MPYYIHIHALRPGVAPPAVTAEQVPELVSRLAPKVGELEMSAGESSLFPAAIQELTGVDVLPLWYGSLWGAEPGPDGAAFGGLSAAEAQACVAAIRAFLDAAGPDQLSPDGARALEDAADTYALDATQLRRKMRKLAELLAAVLAGGATPVATYE